MGDDDEGTGPGGPDTRLFWMEERISNALRLKPEKLKALQGNADARYVPPMGGGRARGTISAPH